MSKDGEVLFYFMVTNILALAITGMFAVVFNITGNAAFWFIASLTNLCICAVFWTNIFRVKGLSTFLLLAGGFSYMLNNMITQRFVTRGDFTIANFEFRDYVILCIIAICAICRLIQISVNKFRK